MALLIRNEQDADAETTRANKDIAAFLSLPNDRRDPSRENELRDSLSAAIKKHDAILLDIKNRFPEYADSQRPKPLTVSELQNSLKSDEAFISIYAGEIGTHVWIVTKKGSVFYFRSSLSRKDIDQIVSSIRSSLEVQVSSYLDLPPFDLDSSYKLYDALIKPAKTSLRSAKSLVISVNGSLGLLPFGLLTTASTPLVQQGKVLFSEYSSIPWLIRNYSIANAPSASALIELRRTKDQDRQSSRMSFAGFGDPVFSASKPALQVAESTSRGLAQRAAPPSEVSKLSDLPALPDTGDELRSIARAFHVDPATSLHLGIAANTEAIGASDLLNTRYIAFATHGLVPGEVNGLDQPALAMSAPEQAGVGGDGLLKMDDIMRMKLNADLVFLSACNTGTGAGPSAEAASGLARAFFFAGAKSVLATNWSVDSVSARMLVGEFAKSLAAHFGNNRGQSLREAMLATFKLGISDRRGKRQVAYAHPFFWAPYSLIGDGS